MFFGNFPHTLDTSGCVENCQKFKKLHRVGCGSVEKKLYFFQKIGFHFSKNCQNYKKKIRVTKKLKNYSLVPIFWYMFCGTNNFFKKIIFFKYFQNFCKFCKSRWDSGDGDVDGDGENFLIGKCCENEIT